MAIFFPGITKCAITNRTLGKDDEVAMFPPFSHPNPTIQRCSDSVIDFAAVRGRPEFRQLVVIFESLIEGKECFYKRELGAVVKLPLDQVQIVFFPLLLSLNSPESSWRRLLMSEFFGEAHYSGNSVFEDYGLRFDYGKEQLTARVCPSKFVPGEAPLDLVQTVNRKGRVWVEPFLRFMSDASPKP